MEMRKAPLWKDCTMALSEWAHAMAGPSARMSTEMVMAESLGM